MRLLWRGKARSGVDPAPGIEPVVLSVTDALTRATAHELARQVERARDAQVVIDLTAIPGFDTDGAEELLRLQETQGAGRVSIVGFGQAAARLVGTTALETEPDRVDTGWVQRRLRHLVVVQPVDEARVSPAGLEDALATAIATDTSIVVVDLRGAETLDRPSVDVIAFASGSAAVRGQEMLVVNVSPEIAAELRSSGLSATTYLAPESPLP